MQLGLVLYGELDTTTGGFRYDRRLVEELRAAGETVTVHELPWYDYHRGLWAGLRGTPPDLERYDVVLQDELAHPTLVGWNRRVDSETPIVSIVHHLRASERWSPLRQRWYSAVERAYLRSVDAVVTTSHDTARTVRAHGYDGPLHVGQPAGDRFDDRTTPAPTVIERRAIDGPLRIVAVGSVVPRKNVHGLIDAVAAVPDCELTVVGALDAAPDYAERLQRQVTAAGIDDRVTFTGFLPDADLADRLAAAHLLAVPSRHEGFGIVYLEAMGFGLPVIASAAGGAGDVVVDGENGYLVSPDDPDTLRERLARLADDRELLVRLGTAAADTAARQPSYTATTTGLRAFLRSRVLDR
ncbi:glycosyltransferase family 4 protein [Haloarchaeobius salinus]|uniref:glycosyltransferase family 4 protein n=1 Tax=Haloarchaeobius salinus TaxID=1198298 RepID=UPI00210B0289|nr:glycosyltransferase family 4 protein [Haloarchaeobius salinus]